MLNFKSITFILIFLQTAFSMPIQAIGTDGITPDEDHISFGRYKMFSSSGYLSVEGKVGSATLVDSKNSIGVTCAHVLDSILRNTDEDSRAIFNKNIEQKKPISIDLKENRFYFGTEDSIPVLLGNPIDRISFPYKYVKKYFSGSDMKERFSYDFAFFHLKYSTEGSPETKILNFPIVGSPRLAFYAGYGSGDKGAPNHIKRGSSVPRLEQGVRGFFAEFMDPNAEEYICRKWNKNPHPFGFAKYGDSGSGLITPIRENGQETLYLIGLASAMTSDKLLGKDELSDSYSPQDFYGMYNYFTPLVEQCGVGISGDGQVEELLQAVKTK